jgi:hypothetical protein
MKASINDLKPRNVVKYDKQTEIFTNGEDNLYPQRVERIINASVTAKSAADKAKNFFIGDGFVDKSLNNIVVYEDVNGKIPLYKLLCQVAHSVSRQKAASVNVQYNGLFEISGVKSLPYRDCRFGKADSNDYSGLIHVYNNWDKKTGVKFDKSAIDKINVFNPNADVVAAQFFTKKDKKLVINRSYKGQVAMLLLDDEYVYPLCQIDACLEDADTEAQIKSYRNSQLRKGFFPKGILYHTKFANDQEQEDFKAVLRKFESGETESLTMMAEAEFDENGQLLESANFKYVPIDANIDSDMFSLVSNGCSNNIRKATWNIPSILIEQQEGSVFGTNGTALKEAFSQFNAETKSIRTQIEQFLKDIFNHSDLPQLKSADFKIKELSYGTLDSTGTAIN